MLKLIFPVVLFFICNFSFGQTKHEWIDIKLNIKHSKRIPNNFVEISIERNRVNKKVVNVEIKSKPFKGAKGWENSSIDTVFTASLENYSKIVESIKYLKQEDFYNNFSLMGVDGYNAILTFGSSSNSITYNVFSPTFNTKNRKLNPFLETCELIVDYVDLNFENIFEKKNLPK